VEFAVDTSPASPFANQDNFSRERKRLLEELPLNWFGFGYVLLRMVLLFPEKETKKR
jgi:hypothetical protein